MFLQTEALKTSGDVGETRECFGGGRRHAVSVLWLLSM